MERVMGPAAAAHVEDDQTEQPAPVFYYDLKEGNRVDFNILIRAHNVVHNVDEADASEDQDSSEAECDADDADGDDEDDEDENDDEHDDEAAADGATSAAAASSSSAGAATTAVKATKKRKASSTSSRKREENYHNEDSEDDFIDDGDMSDTLESLNSEGDDAGTDSDSELQLPDNILRAFERIETEHKEVLERFRSSTTAGTKAAFGKVAETKPLLIQLYSLILDLPARGSLRKIAHAKLEATFYPLQLQTIKQHAKPSKADAESAAAAPPPDTSAAATKAAISAPLIKSVSNSGSSSSSSSSSANAAATQSKSAAAASKDALKSSAVSTVPLKAPAAPRSSAPVYAALPDDPWAQSHFVPSEKVKAIAAAAAAGTTTLSSGAAAAHTVAPFKSSPPAAAGLAPSPTAGGKSRAEAIEIDDDGDGDGDGNAMDTRKSHVFADSQTY